MALILSNLLRTTAITPVSLGGTGVTSITGLVKGNSTAAFTAAQSGVDYIAPSDGLGTPAGGDLSACTNAVAYGIKTSSTTISLSTAIAPTDGQMLTANSASTAIWKTLTVYAGTTLLNSTSGNLALTGITGFSTTASSTATPSLNIAVNTGANSVTGLSYNNLASGSITIASGSVASGKSGGVTINTGNATSSGDINIKPGTSTSYAAELRISAGDGDLADISYGGNTFISAGSGLGGSISSNGGITFISGGNPSGFTVNSTGGDVYIAGGAASPSASGIRTNGNVMIGTQTTAAVNIASTSNSSQNINIGFSTSTTTITGTAKLPSVGTSGLVRLGTGGTLSAVTPSIGYLNWTGSAFAWSEPTIPTASTTVLGGVKQGSNVTIAGDGTISVATPYTLTAATTSALGGVIIPVVATSGITNTSGTIGLAVATNTQLGGVKIDNSTITINNGIISVSSSFTTGLSIGTTLTIPTGDTESRPTATQGNLRFNTSLGKFEGYYGSAWGAVGGGLSPTAVQTANGYIAKANDLVRCNTTSGAFSITLPSAPVDGDIIGVVDTHKKFALNNLTILAAGSKKIEDDTTSLVLDIDGSYIALVYNDVNSNWRILETPLGTGISSTTIITSNGYVASVNDLVRCDTTAAAFSVTLPTNPIDGSIVNFVDVASTGSFLSNNLTVLPDSGNTVENDSSLILDVNGTYVSLVYNLSTTNWKVLQAPYCLLGNVSTSVTLAGLTFGTGNNLTNAVAGVDYMPAVTWVIKNTTYNPAVAGDYILANTSGGAFTITLPASPTAGNTIVIADYAGTFATSNLTIASNGNKILGTVQDLELNVSNRNATLVYTDSTRGWILLF